MNADNTNCVLFIDEGSGDGILVRKLIECVRILSKEKIRIIFKSGYGVDAAIENKIYITACKCRPFLVERVML